MYIWEKWMKQFIILRLILIIAMRMSGSQTNDPLKNKTETLGCDFGEKEASDIIQLIKENPSITQKKIHEQLGISLGTIKRILPRLQKKGILVREGGKRFGKWVITDENR